jgi:hypothetical protein
MTDEGPQSNTRRIVDHPILGPLPSVRIVTFTFDGLSVEAREGEPIAAALLAAGIRVFRTMPRTGEPRGGYCFVGRCADCLTIVDGESNVMACLTPVLPGTRVETQHGLGAWGSDETGS